MFGSENIGDAKVKVNELYAGVQGSYTLAKLAYNSSVSPIWRGDAWEFKQETQAIEKTENGLIFYEDFRDGYNNDDWVIIDTLETSHREQGSINIDSVNGLVLTISREGTRGTEKYGLRTKNPLSMLDGVFVAEFNTTNLAVSTVTTWLRFTSPGMLQQTTLIIYPSLHSCTLVDGILIKIIIPMQLLRKELETIFGNILSPVTRCHVYGLLYLIRLKAKMHVYYYDDNYNGYVDYLFGFSNELYTQPYIYLDIGVWSGKNCTFNVRFPWIKIYRDLSFVVRGLGKYWRVLLVDNNGNILGDKTVPPGEESVSFHRINDNNAYPFDARIIVIPSDNDASKIGYIINPGEVRVITGLIEEPLPSTFKIKVVTSEGVETVHEIRQR